MPHTDGGRLCPTDRPTNRSFKWQQPSSRLLMRAPSSLEDSLNCVLLEKRIIRKRQLTKWNDSVGKQTECVLCTNCVHNTETNLMSSWCCWWGIEGGEGGRQWSINGPFSKERRRSHHEEDVFFECLQPRLFSQLVHSFCSPPPFCVCMALLSSHKSSSSSGGPLNTKTQVGNSSTRSGRKKERKNGFFQQKKKTNKESVSSTRRQAETSQVKSSASSVTWYC